MTAVLLASFSEFSSAPGILIVLIATIVLLLVRAWSGTIGLNLTRLVSIMLDVVIALLVVFFLLFVIIRFQTLA
jgi:hypothetical protein